MRYSSLTPAAPKTAEPSLPGWPALMNPVQAESFVGGPAIFTAMCEHGWVRPVVQQRRLTRYHHENLCAAVARLAAGETLTIGRAADASADQLQP